MEHIQEFALLSRPSVEIIISLSHSIYSHQSLCLYNTHGRKTVLFPFQRRTISEHDASRNIMVLFIWKSIHTEFVVWDIESTSIFVIIHLVMYIASSDSRTIFLIGCNS